MSKYEINLDPYWLPFTPNRAFKAAPRIVVAAEGMHYTKQNGDQLLDGTSGLWCVGAGHKRAEINDAITRQLNTLDYAPPFQVASGVTFMAAERITAMAPVGLNHVLFCNSGSEAVDTAMKLALAYHRARGEGQRTVFIGRERAYHGVGFGGISVGGLGGNRKAFGAMLPRVDHLAAPFDKTQHAFSENALPEWGAHFADELENRIIPLHDASNIAAVIIEPVQGSTGWILPPAGYLQRIRQICDKHGLLLIFDEVITGFGRLGKNFAADYFGVVPDMLTFAKCVTNGIIPLGGVLLQNQIYDALMHGPDHVIEFFHGYTYSGNPVACAAALATLDLYEREQLFPRAAEMGKLLSSAMHGLKGLPNVASIRTLELAGAVDVLPYEGKPSKRGYDIFVECFEQGVLVRVAGDTLVFAPPFIVTPAQIAQMVEVLAKAIRKFA